MSLLLALFSIGLTAKMVGEVAKDVTKIPARSQMQEDCKNGSFDVVKNFEQILYVNDVKRKALGTSSVKVLPFTGFERCIPFIRNHHLCSKADEQRFVTHYKKVLSEELADRQREFDAHYDEIESEVRYLMNAEEEWEIVRFEHIDALIPQSDIEMKVNKMCNTTFFADFLVGEVKIKQNPSGNAFTEIWALKIPISMRGSLKRYYEAAAQSCGYLY